MLVLSRKKNDSIVIDGNITIEIVQIKGNQVRIGISAPRDVRVLRGELKPFESVSETDSRQMPIQSNDFGGDDSGMCDSGESVVDLSQLIAKAG